MEKKEKLLNKEPLEYYQNLFYTITIKKRDYNNDIWHEAHCVELGKMSCYGIGDDPVKALKSFLDSKNDFINMLYKANICIPIPIKNEKERN